METSSKKFGIVVHGGAGDLPFWGMNAEREKEYIDALTKCLKKGYEILEGGGTAIDAVEASIITLEDEPLFNAGKGSAINRKGAVENDASIMDGKTMRAGAVSVIKGIKNPISLARIVMDKSGHLYLSGEGAMEFAKENGFEFLPQDYFITQERFEMWLDKKNKPSNEKADEHGTAGAVALDSFGNLAAGTSTGGLVNKRVGRVGDSAIIGAGTYASNETCAVSCSGTGEYIIRSVTGHEISSLLKYKKMKLDEACEEMLMNTLNPLGGQFGIIAIDRNGNVKTVFNTQRMYRAWQTNSGEREVLLY